MKYLLSCSLFLFGSLPFIAHAEDFAYKCFSYYWNGYLHEKGIMVLSLESRSATGPVIEGSWDDSVPGGEIDPSYRSRGRIKYVKFGRNLIVEESLRSGGRKLRDGNLGGFARVEGQAEGGFYQYKFVCRRE